MVPTRTMPTDTTPRPDYFLDDVAQTAFNSALRKELARVLDEKRSQYVRAENVLLLRHGENWEHPRNPDAINADPEEQSATTNLPFQALVDNNLRALDHMIVTLTSTMQRHFETTMYASLFKATERTGNVVDAKSAGSLEEAFAAMFEKIELHADKNGNVSLPEVHASPEQAKKLEAALEAAPPEFHERIEAMKARKIAEARQREAERRNRFISYGEDA